MAKKQKAQQPLTPGQIIKQRRRKLADRADISAFFCRLAFFIVMVVAVFGVVFGLMPMPNNDMSPRISAGDLLLYFRLADTWNNSDVMVFEKEGKRYVGRIVAQGGDTVEVTEDATLVINGSTVLEDDIYYSTPRYESDVVYPVTLGEGEFFVLCDYREGAKDSRYFGPVSTQEIRGKVITVIRRSGL